MRSMTARDDSLTPVISVRGLQKSFGHVQALRGVSLDIYQGQVLALVGDNGAGKSTLMKIISGAYTPDQGVITVDGESFNRLTPARALKMGIATVYQDLALVDCRDVACNIFLGCEPTKAKLFVDKGKMLQLAAGLLERLNLNIPSLYSEVGSLSGGQRQGIAVARAVNRGARIFIFDEPTAAMGIQETNQILKLIRGLADAGLTALIVSHNLQHVFAVADRICVMRQGILAGEAGTEHTTPAEIVELITGANFDLNEFGRRQVKEYEQKK